MPRSERIFAAGFWTAAAVLVALTVVYLVVVAVVVPRAVPAGSASLLPWFAFAPVGVLFGLGTYCAAPLLHFERYVWPALRGAAATIVAFCLTLIVVALGGGVVWIGLAVSTGYGVALLLLSAELVSIGRLSSFALPTRWALRAVWALWPKVAASTSSGVIGGQVFVLIERALTAPLGVGAVASISYARGVAFTPSVLGQAIGAGLYPSLLRAHAAAAADYVRERFVSGLRLTLFVTAVSGAYIALFSGPITKALFDRDAVSASSLVVIQQCLLAFSLALLGWMLTIYSSRMFGALNLFRGLILQELVALLVFLAVVLLLRDALGTPGVALAFGIGQVAGGLAAVGLIVSKLGVRLRTLAAEAMLPAAGRALPVAAGLALVAFALVDQTEVPPVAAAVAGALTALLGAIAVLWRASWPELGSMRGFFVRVRRRAARGNNIAR